jgi:chloramphenicol O-acetyltransferase type A
MERVLNKATWARKDHFHFFNQFEEPFFGITVAIDCTVAYRNAKEKGNSFFLHYLHKSLIAANQIEAFSYRIRQHDVIAYDEIHASPTINRPDGTFGFSYMTYYAEAGLFYDAAKKEIARIQNSDGLIPAISGENVIHYSALPWLAFTSVSHARAFSFKDSIPKITFGKITVQGNSRSMPVAIHAHHALMDGYHVSQYVELFQELMNQE